MSARGKLRLIETLIRGEATISEKFSEKMFQCLSCLNCAESCPSGVDPVKIINAAKSEVVNHRGNTFLEALLLRHFLPFNRRLRLLSRIAGFGLRHFPDWVPAGKIGGFDFSPSKNGKRRRLPQIDGSCLKDAFPEVVQAPRPALRVLFFTGCMGDFVNQKACAQIIKFLNGKGVEVILSREMACCGAPQYYSGEREIARELACRNLKIMNDWKPDYIINNCATCGMMLKEIYPLLISEKEAGPMADKVMDIHAFLARETATPRSAPGGRKVRVTYHDPCHLARGQGVRAEPRDLLRATPWVEYVEMEDADACCGGAGAFSVKYYKLALEIASRKVEAIRKTGAEVVATGCPSCQMHIRDALYRAGLNVPVVHTTEILLKKFDTMKQNC